MISQQTLKLNSLYNALYERFIEIEQILKQISTLESYTELEQTIDNLTIALNNIKHNAK